jgi:P pilus assembly chaperone PapD
MTYLYKKDVPNKGLITKRVLNTLFVLIILNLIAILNVNAQGNLLVMPRRVLFEGAKRTQELNLANTGNDSAKYVISVINYRMKKDGNFEIINQPDSGQYFAGTNFRFFPRMVLLGPNEAQVVKVQLTGINDLKPGEYRSHLYFRAINNEKPLGEKDVVPGTSSINVKLIAVFGISIPVIFRIGENTTQTQLKELNLVIKSNENPALSMNIYRSGNMSVYGDLKVYYISASGVKTQVGLVNGLAVYAPNQIRQFQVNLDKHPEINYHTGKLQVIYSAQDDAKPAKFAEGELLLK